MKVSDSRTYVGECVKCGEKLFDDDFCTDEKRRLGMDDEYSNEDWKAYNRGYEAGKVSDFKIENNLSLLDGAAKIISILDLGKGYIKELDSIYQRLNEIKQNVRKRNG